MTNNVEKIKIIVSQITDIPINHLSANTILSQHAFDITERRAILDKIEQVLMQKMKITASLSSFSTVGDLIHLTNRG